VVEWVLARGYDHGLAVVAKLEGFAVSMGGKTVPVTKEVVAARLQEFTDDELAAMGLTRKPQKGGKGKEVSRTEWAGRCVNTPALVPCFRGARNVKDTTRLVSLHHASPRKNVASIHARGLLPWKAKGKLKVVWLHSATQPEWAVNHVAKRHDVDPDGV